MSDKFRQAITKAWLRLEERQWILGRMGRVNPSGSVTFNVPGRKGFVYVRVRNSVGAQSTVPARNDGAVPHTANLPVKMKLENGVYVIHSRTSRADLNEEPDTPPSGVFSHPLGEHSDVDFDDYIDGYVVTWNDTLGMFVLTEPTGGGVTSVNTQTGDVVLNTDDIGEGATNLYTTATSVGAAIHGASEKNTIHDDDEFGGIDTEASNVLTWWKWSTIVSTLQTYFDALYATVDGWIKADGTVELTADWDVGEDRAIKLERLQARDAEGILFYDDDGNIVGRISDEGDFGFGGVPISAIRAFFEDGAARIRISSTTNDESAGIAFGAKGASGAAGNAYMFFKGHQTEALRHLAFAADASNVNMYLYGNGPIHIPSNNSHVEELIVGDDVSFLAGFSSESNTGITVMDADSLPFIVVGKLADRNFLFTWIGNGDASGYGAMEAFGGSNPLAIQRQGGKTVFGMAPTSMGASLLGVAAGASGNDAAVGGVLYVNATTVGNVGAGEDNLMGYVVPANTLSVNGQSLWFEATGKAANNGNSKTVRVYFGGTEIFAFAPASSFANEWIVRGRGVRTGSSGIKWSVDLVLRLVGSQTTVGMTLSTTAVSLSSNRTLQFTGQATSNNDVTQETLLVGFDDANT